ncbi:haloacid dehalogenase type II [Halogeometricum limi]|uniref:2-haloacid dehalogenase n=1 Tax=Halogeometricum limi TaxID=555875 RepID=A0A1I6GXM5_9EURY|nr:haloacid dehalogenase type II [Halogeometricum limi]SFR47013.1 2-haloacid dehalogenase [Halogeometricum limi]
MARALCFDMYGTLCDTSTVTTRLSEELDVSGAVVDGVERTWRERQLRYSTHAALMESYEPFWNLTARGLDYALALYDLDPSAETRRRILEAYDELEPFPDADETLRRLSEDGRELAVLSNGNPAMLKRLAENTGLMKHLDRIVSAGEVETFKPAPAVYEHAADRLDRSIGDCRLVSSNAWDVAGAGAAGMKTAWVNRRNDPPEELGADPDRELRSLEELADTVV